MSQDTYDVYFSGACLKTADPAETQRKIGAMFKLEGEKLERLFSGKPMPIKRGVDMDQAVRFRVAFRDAGALVDIVPAGQPAPDPAARAAAARERPAAPAAAPASTPAAAAPPSAPSGLSLADGPLPPSDTPPPAPVASPDYGLSAPRDFNLSDCAPPVEAAEIPDISALALDNPGATLDEHPEPEPLEIDTEALELDPVGTTLIEETPVVPPQIDTESLTMAPPREGSLEAYQQPVEPAPLPNIDHLGLEQPAAASDSPGKAKFDIADD
ncbi:MAG: hypothetical protein P8178_12390 [Candidatus Thiodiazotropha sp.]